MAEVEPSNERYANEYGKGYGKGPFGISEITVCRGFTCNPIVSILSALALWGFVIYVSVDSENAKANLKEGQTWVTTTFTWLYIGSQAYWLLWLIPLSYYYGHVKLGKDNEEPEFSDLSYFSMVFCAGVAIGLIFYGASEPLWHLLTAGGANRYSNSGYANQNQMAQDAMNVTIFHWGMQAWVVYAVVAISMGLLSYRQGLPLTFRTTMAPLFGNATWGWFGDFIDVVTIVTVVSGLCTSLGLGAKQCVAGMQRLEWLSSSMSEDDITLASVITVIVVTCVATLSVVSGVKYGVKTLSLVAFFLGNFLMCSVFFMDDPWFLLNSMTQSLGYHIQHFIQITLFTDAFAQLKTGEGRSTDGFGAAAAWMDWWTIFYWGWWISWAPFVGTFLARISRGRTINNVLLYTLTAPCAYALVWFVTLGGAGLRMHRRADFIQQAGGELYNNTDYFLHTDETYRPSTAGKCFDVPKSLPGKYAKEGAYVTNHHVTPVCLFSYKDDAGYWFDLMGSYHGMGPFLSTVSVITIILYFVTSSDSGSLVVDLIAANGREAHVLQRVFWALSEGAVAVALLQAGGSDALNALRAMSIIMGLPFTVILMFICTATWRALKIDQGHMPLRKHRTDWALPLCGGIFDCLDVLLSCGQAPCPDMKHILNFFIGIFMPNVVYMRVLRLLTPRMKKATESAETIGGAKIEASSSVEDGYMMCAVGISYYAFWILHILCWAGVNDGFSGLAWTAYVAFAGILSVSRYTIRKLYSIEGNPLEDFFCAAFLFPQALAQMAEQVLVSPPPPPTNF
mmetsp:Transcript_51847/g.160872  ORF Transcript_51847/g.160872 Transcript_51847/m.160872 type:complete len:792 (+) Transcript_51847:68-2443(+)